MKKEKNQILKQIKELNSIAKSLSKLGVQEEKLKQIKKDKINNK